MEKESCPFFIDNNSWLDCLGQLKDDQNCFLQTLPFLSQDKTNDGFYQSNGRQFTQLQNGSNQDLIDYISMQESVDKQLFKRSHPESIINDEFFSSNSSSDIKNHENEDGQREIKPGYKKEKYAKQYIYSKNYRDKKKEQFKVLEQENRFLKNKIEELQIRLREKEMEINRLKHHSNEKELTIEELNRQYITKVELLSKKFEQSVLLNEEQVPSSPRKLRSALQDQFKKASASHGVCGTRKKQILNYHMNEIFQVVLRDSEKYFCMLCCKNKDDRFDKSMPEYQKINTTFFEIMELKEEDMERIKTLTKFIFPAMKQVKKECSEMYKCYNKVLTALDKVHQFMEVTYLQNIDLMIKRMKLESWFQYHKYYKIMRKLKTEWIDFIRNEKQNDNRRKQEKASKRKKTNLIDDQ